MQHILFGDQIRWMRKQNGLTQEALSAGICSPSTLSRIENNSREPSVRVFVSLMEKLDGPGFSFAVFMSKIGYQRECLAEEFQEAIEMADIDLAMEKLDEYRERVDLRKPETQQFYLMGKWLCKNMIDPNWELYKRMCKGILRLRRPRLEFDENFLSPGRDLYIARGRIDIVRADWKELWILNNLALAYMHTNEYEMACRIYLFMDQQMGREDFVRKRSWKARAVVSNNLALCMLDMKEGDYAKRYAEKAMNAVRMEGGLHSYSKLIRLRMEVNRFLGDEDSVNDDRQLLKCLGREVRFKLNENEKLEDYLWKHREMLVL